jgi:hypothetical protein
MTLQHRLVVTQVIKNLCVIQALEMALLPTQTMNLLELLLALFLLHLLALVAQMLTISRT